MVIQLNFKSGKPVYLQIVDQIRSAAASGVLKAGEALPSIRPLAEELKVNRNTISRAYAELEHQGIVENQQGRGTFVTGNHSPLKKEMRRRLVAEEIDRAIVQAHHMQLNREDFQKLVQERLDAMEKLQGKSNEKATS